MKQFSLKLLNITQRPVAHLKDFYGFDAMLDTGALFPVWVEDEDILKDLSATLIKNKVEFGGFGGNAFGKLYQIPLLKVGDLIFPNIHIIACRLQLPCQIIMSATMFRGLIYEIDDYNHSLNVTIPDKESNIRNLVIRL